MNLNPERAINLFDRILKTDDPDALDALLILMAGIAPTEREDDEVWESQDKYKHEAAAAAIQYGYRKTRHCDQSAWNYLREVV